jgi:hypothetical protein
VARVPSGAWELTIDEIWRVRGELWVFATVNRPPKAIGAQMICNTFDEVTLRLPDLPLRIFIEGKTWAWENKEKVEWISANAPVFRQRREGDRLWRRPPPPAE